LDRCIEIIDRYFVHEMEKDSTHYWH